MSKWSLFQRALLAAAVAYLWMPERASAQTHAISIGLNANYEQHLAQSAKIGWSRLDIVWRDVNPAIGVWNFAALDSQVNYAVSKGQKILAILHYTPTWLAADPARPPLSTAPWAEFVRKVAARYHGRIQAYEIWNEPDLKKSQGGGGIGWTRNIEEPPLYIDFVHSAAVEIRSQSPGSLVVAPAFLSNNDASGSPNRKKRILQQICAANYPGGAGPSFVDVVSVHNNANEDESSRIIAYRLRLANLAYVKTYCPALLQKPVWVTEYGWKTSQVSEASQREKICNVTKMYTGLLEPGSLLGQFNMQRSFIYVQKRHNVTSSIFREDGSPKSVVSTYLQKFGYPALQQPALSLGFPSCLGVTPPLPPVDPMWEPTPAEISDALTNLGLNDPSSAYPAGFTPTFSYVQADTGAVGFLLNDGQEGWIQIHATVLSGDPTEEAFLTSTGSKWTLGKTSVSISGGLGEAALGKESLRELSLGLHPGFDSVCKEETFYDDSAQIGSLGLDPPAAPVGFELYGVSAEIVRPTGNCIGADMSDPVRFEVVWTFTGPGESHVKAGVYKLTGDSVPATSNPSSLHWTSPEGHTYWVAAWDVPEGLSVGTLLNEFASSMGGAF